MNFVFFSKKYFRWEFTTPVFTNELISFNLTGPLKKSDASLIFAIKFNRTTKKLKFDTIVDQFDSEWKSKANFLVFEYK